MTPHLFFSCLWTGICTIGFPGSQAFELELNYSTGFPEPPAYRQQMVGRLSLHCPLSQVLIQILILRVFMEEQNIKDEFSELVLEFLELAL